MKSKTFFITDTGHVSRHKVRDANIAGHGILHEDQFVRAYTSEGRTLDIAFDEVKVGTHFAKPVVGLNEGEVITKIDISLTERAKQLLYGMYP